MATEDLDSVRVTFTGLVGDRVWAFVDNGNSSNFPWMTARQGHELVLFRPQFPDPPPPAEESPDPANYRIDVITSDGKKFRLDDPRFTEYVEKWFGRSLRLRFSERTMADAQPVSLFGMGTLRALSEETGKDLDARSFRSNFYVEWDNGQPFYENSLIGRELQIGDTVVVQAVKKAARCIIVTLDPEDASSAPKILEAVSRSNGGCVGIYGAVLREGIVQVNDLIYLI
jgi:uncharacterized protein